MSFEHAAIAMNHTQASGAVRAVMIGIASHANDDGEAYPGMMKLAQYGGYDGYDAHPEDDSKAAKDKARDARANARRSAIKAVQKLAALGEITVETNGGGTVNRPDHMRPNLYKVTLTCPPNCDHSAQHRLLTPEETTGRLRAALGLTQKAVAEPVDNSQNDPVAPRPPRGPQATTPVAPRPPESSTNHQENQDTISDLSLRDDPEDEKQAEAVAGQFEDWHPGVQVARAAAQVAAAKPVKRPDLSKSAAPIGKTPPAPHVPRYRPEPTPPPDPPRWPAEEAAVQVAALLPCPEGFGGGKHRLHWFPGTLTGCARCGREALDLATPQQLDQEAPECQS